MRLGLGLGLSYPKRAGSSYEGPLDLVPGAIAAFGQRALSNAWLGGNLYTIRRSSDDATQTFAASAVTGAVSAAAVSAFIGGGSGFSTTWHDQSASAKNVVQATGSKQPTWLADQYGTAPGFSFDASASQFLAAGSSLTISVGEWSIFVVATRNTTGELSKPAFLGIGGSAYTDGEGFEFDYITANNHVNFDSYSNEFGNEIFAETNSIGSDTNNHLFELALKSDGADGITGSFRLDGAAVAFSSAFSFGTFAAWTGALAIGQTDAVDPGTTNYFNGKMAEVLLYNSKLSDADRTLIRANMAAYYGITLS